MQNQPVIGVFFSGRYIKCGKVVNGKIEKTVTQKINNRATEEEVVAQVIEIIDSVFDDEVTGIGIGVPSVVDVERGIVYEVKNIPSWIEVHIKDILENHFGVKVYVNNDANCFTVGEKYFGVAKDYENIVGLILSTGVGAGIIFKGHLYWGTNCGAGEFGYLPYKDFDFEYYCSEKFFEKKFGLNAELVYQRAMQNDKIALAIYEQYGENIGHLIKAILYTVDPEIIVIGGSSAKGFPFFKKEMLRVIKTFQFHNAVKNLKIVPSKHPDIAVLGAAALFYDAQNILVKKF